MKRLLFLIFFLSAIGYGQYKDVIIKYNAADSTVLILPSFVVFNVPTLDTRLDSLIAALTAVESAADTRIDSILANSLPELDTRTDSLIAVVSADKDSTTSHNDRINALLDTAKVHQDTLASHNDRILALLDSVNNHYSQAILDILLAAKFDKADTTDYYTDAMIDALLAYKFDKSDTSNYYKAVHLDALLSYYFLKSDTTDYYKDVMVDALLGYKLNLTDTSYQVQDSYLSALLPYYYVRTDTSSATLGFYPRNMIDAKIAEITGTGVITLNGLSGVSQTFAIDTTIAGAPAWSSVGTTHTLQLPFSRFLFWKDTSSIVMPWELGAYQEKGTYVNTVTASGDIESTGGTEPNISLGTGKVAPSAGDTTIWNAKLSASQVYPLTYAAKQAGSKINTNHLYVTTDDSIDVSSEGSGVTAEQISDTADVLRAEFNEYYEGAFTGTNYADTLTGTFNSYDRWLVNPIAVTDADTMSNPLLPFPKKDTLIVIRKSDGCKSGLVYGAQRKLGALSPVTSVDAVAISSDTITVTWTAPVTSSASTARTVDSVAVSWSKSGHRTDLTDAGDSVHYYVKTILADTISSLETSTLYYVDLFTMTYSDELSAYAGDTCTTEASAIRDNYLLDSLHVFWAFDESSGDATDSHHGLILTNNNTATYEAGLLGNCVRTDSIIGSCLSIADNYWVQGGDKDWTIVFWAMPKDTALSLQYLCGKYSEYKVYRDAFEDVGLQVYDGTSASAGIVLSPQTWEDTTAWVMVSAWHNEATDSIYISYNNGTFAQKVESQALGVTTNAFVVGGFTTSNTQKWTGLIDNLVMWGRVLTAEERTELYNSGAGKPYSEFK